MRDEAAAVLTPQPQRGPHSLLASSQAVRQTASLHKPAGCCNRWLVGHAKVAPLLLTGFNFAGNSYPGFGQKVGVTQVSAGYGSHLEGRH